eukprot:scaffold383903_cov21-Prasinocladus_malaysianus.AAC.1
MICCRCNFCFEFRVVPAFDFFWFGVAAARVLQCGRDGDDGDRRALHGHGRRLGPHGPIHRHQRHPRAPGRPRKRPAVLTINHSV